jgi:hypothetical protein
MDRTGRKKMDKEITLTFPLQKIVEKFITFFKADFDNFHT